MNISQRTKYFFQVQYFENLIQFKFNRISTSKQKNSSWWMDVKGRQKVFNSLLIERLGKVGKKITK